MTAPKTNQKNRLPTRQQVQEMSEHDGTSQEVEGLLMEIHSLLGRMNEPLEESPPRQGKPPASPPS